MSDSQQPTRQHYWDPLRALLMLLGIPYHASLLYSETITWDIKANETSTFLTVLGGAIVTFRMPAFFLIAGYFSLMIIEKKGCKVWLKSRLIRLGIPFVTALLLLAPPQLLLIELARAAKGNISLDAALTNALDAIMHPSVHWIMHLWFLPALLIYSAALATLWRLSTTPIFLPVKAAYKKLSGTSPSLTLFLVCAAPVAWEMLVYSTATLAQQSGNALLQVYDKASDPYVRYALFYLVGTLLYADKPLLHRFRQTEALTALVALAAIIVTLYLRWHPFTGRDAALLFASSIAAISVTRCLLDYSSRHLDAPNAFVRNVTDASLTIYLLHHPLIYAFGTLFLIVNISPFMEFSITVLATAGLAYAAHQLIKRSRTALFLFNGVSDQRSRAECPATISTGNTLR
jgi:glucan biosynthesis protein C